MQITIEIPDKTLAAEAYRAEVISAGEVRRMLKLSSRWEAHGFLKQEGAYLHYTLADLEQDVEAIRSLKAKQGAF